MKARTFFTSAEQQLIVAAILAAERNTSGEIRLHLEDTCKTDPKEEAIAIFEKLGMTGTMQRNGVLIFLAVQDKKFAIIGDKGIDEAVPEDFWDSIRDDMAASFRRGEFLKGLTAGIAQIGEKLKIHFPYRDNDADELSNEISY